MTQLPSIIVNPNVKAVTVRDASYRLGDEGLGEDHKGKVTEISIEFIPELKAMEFIVYVDGNSYIHLPYHSVTRWVEK